MYVFLDWFFEILHVLLIIFILSGWVWRQTRKAHLVVTTLTILSWILLGMRYGFGYCPFTDWHWQVKARLGATELPSSFVKYLADSMTGLEWDSQLVDGVVGAGGLFSFIASMWLNWQDSQSRRSPSTQ